MIRYNPGDIVLVPFPFTNLARTKKRPALVLQRISSQIFPDLFILAMMTSNLHSEMLKGDVILATWKEAGLPKPTKIRLTKLATLEQGIILKKIGSLSKEEWKKTGKEFLNLFSFSN